MDHDSCSIPPKTPYSCISHLPRCPGECYDSSFVVETHRTVAGFSFLLRSLHEQGEVNVCPAVKSDDDDDDDDNDDNDDDNDNDNDDDEDEDEDEEDVVVIVVSLGRRPCTTVTSLAVSQPN